MKTTFFLKTLMLFITIVGVISCASDDDDSPSEVDAEIIIEVTTLAGADTPGSADGLGENAQFSQPRGIAVGPDGVLYVTDSSNHVIRKITPDGEVTTFAGGVQGTSDGTGVQAEFDFPIGIVVDSQGNLFVTDNFSDRIRKITPSAEVSTFAGGIAGFTDGAGINAQFRAPQGITIDAQDNLYIADRNNHSIRKITPSGEVTTIAGGTEGFEDGLGANAQFKSPTGIARDDEGVLYIVDKNNHSIRKIMPNGEVSTIAGDGTFGLVNGIGTDAQFGLPRDIIIDRQGDLLVTDTDNSVIRKITPDGEVSTFLGTTEGFTDGTPENVQFNFPTGIVLDTENNIFITDRNNNRIRKITKN